MRKLVVALIVLAVLLVIVDRVAVAGVQREIARQVEAAYDLPAPPSVKVAGVPFLTQAISGHYKEITVDIGPLTRAGVRLSEVTATLSDVTAPLADLIQNPMSADIRARRVTGTVVISPETLSARAPRGIHVEADGDTLKVSGEFTVLGRTVPVTADLRVKVVKGAIRLTPHNVELGGGFAVPDPERLITFSLPIPKLPLDLRVSDVRATPQGLAVEGTASDVSLR